MPLEYEGRDLVARFCAGLFAAGRRVDFVPTRANGQPAFGVYKRASSGLRNATGLITITLAGDRICATSRFDASVLPWFGLPLSLPSIRPAAREVPGLVAGAGYLAAERIEPGQLVLGEGDVEGGDVLLEPLDALGTGDRDHRDAEAPLLGIDPGERDLRGGDALGLGDRAHGVGDRLVGCGAGHQVIEETFDWTAAGS